MEEHFLGKVATKGIIVRDGKILMTRDHRGDAFWDLPGGRINVGESIEMGLRREIQEELGVEVSFKRMIYSEQLVHTGDGSPHLFITCEVVMENPDQPFRIPSDELAEVRWVDKDTIKDLKTYDNCMRAINAFWQT